jgi:hypothetical protein
VKYQLRDLSRRTLRGKTLIKFAARSTEKKQHLLDFVKAELDVEGSFGSEGNLII